MKKILVTGASGFVGKHVQTSLCDSGFRVYPTSRTPREGYLFFDALNQDQSLKLLGEILPDIILNLSWHTSGVDYSTSSQNEIALNWSTSLFELTAKSSAKTIISVGTAAEGLTNPYAITKELAHQRFLKTFAETDKRALWLKVFQVYGPEQSATRFIPSLFTHIAQNSIFTLKQPAVIRDWIDVRDVAEAIKYLMTDSVEPEIEIGTSEGIANQDICKFMQKKFGLCWKVSESKLEKEFDRLVASSNSPLFKYFQPNRKLFDYLKDLKI
jgi:nucleoside-diphosphate-sugar epimerase